MDKKDLLENIGDYSPKEIASAIKSGLVSFYELRSGTHGQFSPLAQRQVMTILNSDEEPELPEPANGSTTPPPLQSQPQTQPQQEPVKETVIETVKEPDRPVQPEYKETTPPPLHFDIPNDPPVQQDKLYTCPECSRIISPNATECPYCGMPLTDETPSVASYQQTPPYTAPTDTTHKYSQTLPNPEINMLNIFHSFNWGGFLFGWLWGICNGVYWSIIILFLNIITVAITYNDPSEGAILLCLFSQIIVIIIHIILGVNGNKMAWNSKRFNNAEQFISTQNKWKKAGFIIYGCTIALSLLTFFIAILAVALA